MKQFLIASYVVVALLIGGYAVAHYLDVLPDRELGAAGVYLLTGSGTKGEKSIASNNDTKIIDINTSRQYLEICKVNATNNVTFSLGVNSSASADSGIQLNNNRPCFIANDLNLVTGAFWALASPSAASISYQEF